ncbi:MAG: TlpA disulfide reductase family protein [Leptospirales bacterium]
MFKKSFLALKYILKFLVVFPAFFWMHAADMNLNYSEYNLTNEKGEVVTLEPYKNKVLVVNFWATWCSPCLKELPELNHISKQFNSKKVKFIAVAVDSKLKKILKFKERHNIDMQLLLDTNEEFSDFLRVSIMPSTYVFDQNGKMILEIEGYSEKGIQKLIQEVEKLIQ